jgi:hypothetical protein
VAVIERVNHKFCGNINIIFNKLNRTIKTVTLLGFCEGENYYKVQRGGII